MTLCAICKNSRGNVKVLAKELFLGTREVFPYILCARCSSLSIENIPQNLQELYEKYPGLQHPNYKKSAVRNFLKRYMITHVNFFAKKLSQRQETFDDLRLQALYDCHLLPTSDILDVGSGSGWFIYELHELGYRNAIGIEPAIGKDQILRNGATIYKQDIFGVNKEFDFISFHHSFEHLENPTDVLKKTAFLLKENGTCLIRLPNIESFAFRVFKEHWSGIHAPYHLFLPSKKGMEILCEQSGFKIIDIRFEQLVESFLRSYCYTLDFASHDTFGTRTMLKGKPLGSRTIPLFTKQEIDFWKAKTKKVREDKLTDYVSYYLKLSKK